MKIQAVLFALILNLQAPHSVSKSAPFSLAIRFLTPKQYPSFTQKYIPSLTSYNMWGRERWKYPQIVNHEQSISHSENCLVIIDNFPNMDLSPSENPKIVRFPHPVLLQHDMVRDNMHYKVETVQWGAPSSDMVNKTYSSNNLRIQCTLSPKYFCGRSGSPYDTSQVCINLNLATFLSHTKPWRCFFQISMFPPTPVLKNMQYSTFFTNKFPTALNYGLRDTYSLPSLSPPHFHIFICKVGSSLEYGETNFPIFQQWILETNKKSRFNVNIFVLFGILLARLQDHSRMGYGTPAKIVKMDIIKYCSDCYFGDSIHSMWNFQLVTINTFPKHPAEALAAAYPLANEATNWQVGDIKRFGFKVDYVSHQFPYELIRCTDSSILSIVEIQVPEILLAYGLANVWSSIMRNYTLKFRNVTHCIHGKGVEIPKVSLINYFEAELTLRPFLKGSFITTAIEDPLHNLRFVSCGRRRVGGIPFEELIKVFDKSTWFAILLSTFSITLPLHSYVNKFKQPFMYILSALKVFLEQGDPFPMNVLEIAELRFVAGTFLLMGIVLSNAYKNTNVYNMVIPRGTIPIETLDELVTNNFTMYSRSARTEKCYTEKIIKCDDCSDGTIFRHNSTSLTWICVTSEVSHVNVRRLNLTRPSAKCYSSKEQPLVKPVRDMFMLHPKFTGMLKDIVKVDNLDAWYGVAKILESETTFLYESMIACENTAVALPEHLCGKFAQRIKNEQNKKGDVSIGKEVYSNIQMFFDLKGVVHPQIFRRFKGVGSAGIFEWWMKLTRRTSSFHELKKFSRTYSPPRPPALDGNVVMLFAVWASGQGVASVCIIIELIFKSLW